MKNSTKKMVLAGMFVAIGLILPFITANIPEIGKRLCPMHIPIMLCGIFCGWQYGLVVGFITPLLRGFLFSMPVIFPEGLVMAFELAAYAVIISIVYKALPKKMWAIYVSLVTAMIGGRIVYGIVKAIIYAAGLLESPFTWQVFITSAIVKAIPGIISQIIIIPILVNAINRGRKEQ